MVVLHGDWHTLQLLAEVIRDNLWDGGFKQMCSECGYKKNPHPVVGDTHFATGLVPGFTTQGNACIQQNP